MKKNKKMFYILCFFIWIIFNIILILRHEPWRDEARAWILAKNLNIKELVAASRFDGHPILWHLILMPFAKLGFPYVTIKFINFIFALCAAYIFYFKTKLDMLLKTLIIFGAPFIYVYTAISRNYSLILFLTMLISYIYSKRYNHPYLYTLLICLLLNTPTIAWGLAISLFIFFNVEETIKLFIHKNKLSKMQIIITNLMFLSTLIMVIVQLVGTSNPDYPKAFSFFFFNKYFLTYIFLSLILFGFYIFKIYKLCYREYIIALIALLSQVFIHIFFYPSLLEIRLFYQCIVWILFIIICQNGRNKNFFSLIFIIIYLPMSILSYYLAIQDIKYNYSSSIETAQWINKNIKEKEILVVDSIFCQSIVPYLNNIKLYDIYYGDYFDNLKVYSDIKKIKQFDLLKYKGKYIILYNKRLYKQFESFLVEIYSSTSSLTGEDFNIYYIK